MLRASNHDKNSPLIIAGISEQNVLRLKNNQPIRASIRSFGVNIPGELVILYGPTEEAIAEELKSHQIIAENATEAVDPKLALQNELIAMHPKILIATVGLPRSGKSTWSKRQAWPIVSPDAIRYAIHGQRYIQEAEGFVWAIARAMVKALFLAGHQIVIFDACSNTRKRRQELIANDHITFYKYIDTPTEVCFDRAAAEKDEYIVSTIERMAKEHEPLAEEEPRWP